MIWIYSSNEGEWYLMPEEAAKMYTGSSFKFISPTREFMVSRYNENKKKIERLLMEQEQLGKDLNI